MSTKGLGRWISASFLVLVTLALPSMTAIRARAQVFDMDYDRQPVVALNGQWRFHPGDDPAWARPGFDDKQWPLLKSTADWSAQGYKSLNGFAWYRFSIVVPENTPPLSLYLPWIMTSYEVYADGVKVGVFGGVPPHPLASHPVPRAFALPSSRSAHTITIALRVWHSPLWSDYYGGGPHSASLVGLTPLVQQRAQQVVNTVAWSMVDQIVLTILEALAGFAALGFFLLRLREREYMWFGLMLLASAALRCFTIWSQLHEINVLFRDDITALVGGASTIFAIAFYRGFLHGRKNWAFWLAVVTTVATVVVSLLDGSLITVKQTQEYAAVLSLPFTFWVLTLLGRRARTGLADARLLLVPVFLQQLCAMAGNAVWLSYLADWQRKYAIQDLPISSWPFYYTLTDLTALLFLLAMLAILIQRFTRTRREEERFSAELDAARSVQHILIPDDVPVVPGFTIASVYKPASEVGGDFYQIIPLAELGCAAGGQESGALVIVGDVSGKGLQAAMTVSLIVGTLRTLADHTQQPATILAGLNRRLIGRSGGGFTTCMVLLVAPSGDCIIASAGHLAPYRNGKEVPVDDGLPLGLTLDAAYLESTFYLAPGDRLTMISDGVLEARNHAGELFGFDRTRALSTQDAAYIAHAAEAFGQEDDITVLTMNRLAEPKLRAPRVPELVL